MSLQNPHHDAYTMKNAQLPSFLCCSMERMKSLVSLAMNDPNTARSALADIDMASEKRRKKRRQCAFNTNVRSKVNPRSCTRANWVPVPLAQTDCIRPNESRTTKTTKMMKTTKQRTMATCQESRAPVEQR